ncbi:MAG TPA: tetratricopeptide repeat protein [Thermoanaerobaculia bacterium]|nr:tetratricopeptide repeat protein [Thermoanaerobaculia bacterium]
MRAAPRIAVAVLLLLSLCRPATGGQTPEVPQPDGEGIEAPVRRELELLRRAVLATPEDAEAWGRYAMTLDAHRLPVAATAAYREAQRLDPGDFRWPYFLGCVLEFTHPEEAARWFERALELDPTYAPVHGRLAQTLEQLGRDDDAHRHYERAAELAPEDPLAQLGLGNLALRRGDTAAARRHLDRAYRLGPEIRAVVATLARALQVAGERERARELALEARDLPRQTLRYDPRRTAVFDLAVDSSSALRRAERYRDVGKLDQALATLEELLASAPENVDAWVSVAGLRDRLGDTEGALAAARRALELAPERLDARAVEAGALFKLRRFDEAERVASQVLARDPDNFHMLLVTAMLDGQRGRVEDLIAGLDHAYRARTGDRSLLQLFATLSADVAESLAGIGRRDLAVTHLERALEVAIDAGAPAAVVAGLRQRLGALRQ